MKTLHASTLLVCAGLLTTITIAAVAGPGDPITTIFREYPPPPSMTVLAIGDFSADPGLEALAGDQTSPALFVVSLASGAVIGDLAVASPSYIWSASSHQILSVLVRDLDHDGYGELLLVSSDFEGVNDAVGAYGFQSGSTLTELWIRLSRDLDHGMVLSHSQFDVADLTVEPTDQIAVSSDFFFVLDGITGATLYSSAADDPLRSPRSMSVDDYDGDGSDEVLLTMMACPSGCIAPDEAWLIGGSYDPGGGGGGGGGGTPAPEIGSRFRLRASYPNPSSGRSSIAFSTPGSGRVQLRIFDAAGRRIRTVADSVLDAGEHVEHWDGKDSRGVEVSSGTYFYELSLDGERISRKLLRVK